MAQSWVMRRGTASLTPARNNLDGRRLPRNDPLGARRTEQFRVSLWILRLAERDGDPGLAHYIRSYACTATA